MESRRAKSQSRESDVRRSHPIPSHPKEKRRRDRSGDPSETVISPFIKFYGPTSVSLPSPGSRECGSRAPPRDFQWRATSLPEIVLVTPREWRKRVEGLKGGTSGIS